MIRKATKEDLPAILPIYAAARAYMRKNGNMTQWDGIDAPELQLENDIRLGQLYVWEKDGIHGAFAFIIGEDATYQTIEDGAWLSDSLYGTIHRLGSDGQHKGVFTDIIQWASAQIPHLRADTHSANATMQYVLQKNGFRRVGVIYVPDGSPRIAFERLN